MHNDYQVGGSVTANSSLYVERNADIALTKALEENELCYIFNTRQIGKSSLLLKTKNHMQTKGYLCSYIDISRIGSVSITAEQWYAGLAFELWRGFSLPAGMEFFNWWQALGDIPPPQKLFIFWQEYLPSQFPDTPLIMFFDEIDSVISLPFAADDFFSVIRSCYNVDKSTSNYPQVNFALFGVALPTDLIKDQAKAPFNIGKAIALDCFTLEEALPLLTPFSLTESSQNTVLTRCLSWTGGQPFLTQKLLAILLEHYNANAATDLNNETIDQIVQSEIIDNWRNNDTPEHLKTIYDRITLDNTNNIQLLSDYLNVCQNTISPEVLHNYQRLYLTGLVHVKNKKVVVKSKIYQTIFSVQWVEAELAKLRPYHVKMKLWQLGNDNKNLLNEVELAEAKSWANSRSISEEDHLYLASSQELINQAVKLQNIQLNKEITQRRLTEEKLQNTLMALDVAKGQAEKANKAKSHFLAKVSHEIRTHVNSIIGINYLARKQVDHAEHLKSIDRAAHYMQTVINDLVDINQIERGELSFQNETFYIDSIIDNLININAPMIYSKGLNFLIDTPKNLTPALIGDHNRIEQVLSNLLVNAIKYCSIGTISIKIKEMSPAANGQVTYRFSITDTGIGVGVGTDSISGVISEDKESPVEMGIGLTICFELLSMMGSELFMESYSGQGTEFSFSLAFNIANTNTATKIKLPIIGIPSTLKPEIIKALKTIDCTLHQIDFSKNNEQYDDVDIFLIDENYLDYQARLIEITRNSNVELIPLLTIGVTYPHWLSTLNYNKRIDLPVTPRKLLDELSRLSESSYIEALSLQPLSNAKTYQVLVAEDDEINQEVIRALLDIIGVTVTMVDNGIKAVETALSTEFDLILMDIEMPLMNGIEAVEKLKSTHSTNIKPYLKSVPIVAMTAHALLGDKQKFIQAGMNDHISKPIEPNQLKAVLSQWLPKIKDSNEINNNIEFPTILNVNTKEGLSRCNNNVLLYRKVLLQFADKYQQTSVLNKEKTEQLRIYFHAIKGTSGNIGANDLSLKSAALEQQCVVGDELLATDLADFSLALTQLSNNIHQALDNFQLTQHSKDRKYQSKRFTLEIALALQDALMSDHSKAIELCSSLVEINDQEIEAICTSVNEFDIDLANNLLEQWISTTEKIH